MRQWAVGLSGEGYRSGSHYSYLYADWTVDLSLKRRVRILLHERCGCSHKWLLSLLSDNNYEVNPGTRKAKQDKTKSSFIGCDYTN
jgi:hypothetical protein